MLCFEIEAVPKPRIRFILKEMSFSGPHHININLLNFSTSTLLPNQGAALICNGGGSLSKVQSGFLSEFQKEIIQESDSAGFRGICG